MDKAAEFESMRGRLWGLAYRMLGSVADAEDAVQDTYLRWSSVGRDQVRNHEAWLTTACTRRCLDLLRAAHRARVDYVGPWLPEPLVQSDDAAADPEQAASLSTAFLLLLERLGPAERAAYLLREVFDQDYDVVAETLDRSPEACRQLVSRARKHLERPRARFTTEPDRSQRLLEGFLTALSDGSTEALSQVLSDDVRLWADGGGKAVAATRVLEGPWRVGGFLGGLWRKYWHQLPLTRAVVNGQPGLILRHDETVIAVMSFAFDREGRVAGVYIMRNPDKLSAVERL